MSSSSKTSEAAGISEAVYLVSLPMAGVQNQAESHSDPSGSLRGSRISGQELLCLRPCALRARRDARRCCGQSRLLQRAESHVVQLADRVSPCIHRSWIAIFRDMKIAQNISGTLGLWNLVGRITVIDYPGQRVCLFADTNLPQEVLAGVSVSVPHTCEMEGCPPERLSGFPAVWIPAHYLCEKVDGYTFEPAHCPTVPGCSVRSTQPSPGYRCPVTIVARPACHSRDSSSR